MSPKRNCCHLYDFILVFSCLIVFLFDYSAQLFQKKL
jgi:hypothetical protein